MKQKLRPCTMCMGVFLLCSRLLRGGELQAKEAAVILVSSTIIRSNASFAFVRKFYILGVFYYLEKRIAITMDIKVRPVTILLLIILLVVGVNAGLYHFGVFDSFLANMENRTDQRSGDGPVVRKEVSNLVLPLKSSESEAGEEADQELNESELSAVESLRQNDIIEPLPAEGEVDAVQKTDAAPLKAQAESVEEKVVPAAPVKEKKKESGAQPQGKAGSLNIECDSKGVVVKVPLSVEAGKVKWFNLGKPRRLVVDIFGKWASHGKSLYRLKDCGVDKIIVGEHPDKLRLVYYFSKAGIFDRLAPEIKKTPPGVVLDLKI